MYELLSPHFGWKVSEIFPGKLSAIDMHMPSCKALAMSMAVGSTVSTVKPVHPNVITSPSTEIH